MSESNKDKKSGRNYRKEYDNYQGSDEQIKKRSARNKARAKMAKEGRVRKGDGKDVDHVKGVEAGNGDANLRVQSKSKNRSYKRTSKGKVEKRDS